MAIEFWFDFASTYSYLAASRIENLAGARGVPLEWRAFLLGPIFQDQGWSDSPFNLLPARGRYMWRDLERLCARYGLPWRKPTAFPRNSVLAARVACAFAAEPWLPEFVGAVFRANFAEDRDISDPYVIGACLDRLGLDGKDRMAMAESPRHRGLLRQETQRAKERGIFGAPTMIVDGELFWGYDRIEQALDWHAEHRGGTQRA